MTDQAYSGYVEFEIYNKFTYNIYNYYLPLVGESRLFSLEDLN